MAQITELPQKQNEEHEKVWLIPIEQLHPFKNHPFKVNDDELMDDTVVSITERKVDTPLIVRPHQDGYEIISGHRRLRAAQLADMERLPAIIRDMDDDEAICTMVDSNIQRGQCAHSEIALAYKMKLGAMKRQGARTDLTSFRQVVGKSETADIVGEPNGDSGRKVQRYVRLTHLIPEILKMVDTGKIGVVVGAELSYLSHDLQRELLDVMEQEQCTPSVAQAKVLKTSAQEGSLARDELENVLQEEKPQQNKIVIDEKKVEPFFDKDITPRAISEHVIGLLQKEKDAELSGDKTIVFEKSDFAPYFKKEPSEQQLREFVMKAAKTYHQLEQKRTRNAER